MKPVETIEDIDAWGSEREDYKALRSTMHNLIRSDLEGLRRGGVNAFGIAKDGGVDLDAAYEAARYMNPETRRRMFEREDAERQRAEEKAEAEAQTAREAQEAEWRGESARASIERAAAEALEKDAVRREQADKEAQAAERQRQKRRYATPSRAHELFVARVCGRN